MTDIGQIMAECDCQHSACWDRKYCMAAKVDSLTAKLATCEKYRDAYDKMGRIGTEAYRDLEAKLAKAVEALQAFKDFDDMPTSHKRPDVFEVSVRRKLLSTLAEIEGSNAP
jgi:hypothetical protein